eukprot:gene35506-46022_t
MSGMQFNENHIFIATLFYSAQKTIKIHPRLKQKSFIYFIQVFEPIFSPHDSNYTEALESYRFPHFAIYSTRTWYKFSKIGQYQFLGIKKIKNLQFAAKTAFKMYPDLDGEHLAASF